MKIARCNLRETFNSCLLFHMNARWKKERKIYLLYATALLVFENRISRVHMIKTVIYLLLHMLDHRVYFPDIVKGNKFMKPCFFAQNCLLSCVLIIIIIKKINNFCISRCWSIFFTLNWELIGNEWSTLKALGVACLFW